MTQIVVGVENESANASLAELISRSSIAYKPGIAMSDVATCDGLAFFCEKKSLPFVNRLLLDESDEDSNAFLFNTFEDHLEGRHSRLQHFAKCIEEQDIAGSVWFMFAETWLEEEDVTLFSGHPSDFVTFLGFNMGPYRRLYNPSTNATNLGDEPVVWEVIHA